MMKNNNENDNKHNNIFNNQHHYRYYCPSNTDYHYKNETYYSYYNDKYPHDNEQTNWQTTRHLTLPGRRSMWVNYHTEIVRRQYWLWLVGHLAYYHQFAWNISRPAGNDTWCTMQYCATTTGLLLILVLFRFCRCWESNTYDVNITSDISTADFTFTNSSDVIHFLERLILYIIIIALPFMIAYYDRYY